MRLLRKANTVLDTIALISLTSAVATVALR
jgi:hypothetical protein